MHRHPFVLLLAVAVLILQASCGRSDGDRRTPTAPESEEPSTPPSDPPPQAAPACFDDVQPIRTRSLVDREDDVEGPQLHFVYAVPADGEDLEIDTNGQLQYEAEVIQRWVRQQVGRCLRMDTHEGALDATFVRFSRTNEELRAAAGFVDQTVRLELEGRGLYEPGKVYVVYYGGSTDSGSCGGAAAVGGPAMQFLNEQLTSGPLSTCPFFRFVSGPLGDFRGSWAGVATHETFHSLGVVPSCAPDHYSPGPMHLAAISSDLMAFDGTGYSTYTLDQSRTEYYGHDNEGCLDLQDSAIWEDAGADAVGLPGRTTWVDATPIPCAEESTTEIRGAADPTTVRFANTTASALYVYRLDETGGRLTPDLVGPFSEFVRDTAEDHVFVVTDVDSGACVGLYRIVSGRNRVLITG